MKPHLNVPLLALTGLLLFGVLPARAQNPYYRSGFIPPTSRPVLSPWLNLTPGRSAALSYFNGVLPQRQFNNQIAQLQQGVAANQQAIQMTNGLQSAASLPPTGHPVTFMSYTQYFGTLGNSGAARTQGGVAPAAAAQPGLGAAGGLGFQPSLRTGSRIR